MSGLILTKGYGFIISAGLPVKSCESLCSVLLWSRNPCSVQHLVLQWASYKYFEVLKVSTGFSSFLTYQIKIFMVVLLRLAFPPLYLTCSTMGCLGQVGQVLDKAVVLVENKINYLMLMHPLPPEFFISDSSHWCHLWCFSKIRGFFPPEYLVFLHSQNMLHVHSVIACLFSKSYEEVQKLCHTSWTKSLDC